MGLGYEFMAFFFFFCSQSFGFFLGRFLIGTVQAGSVLYTQCFYHGSLRRRKGKGKGHKERRALLESRERDA